MVWSGFQTSVDRRIVSEVLLRGTQATVLDRGSPLDDAGDRGGPTLGRLREGVPDQRARCRRGGSGIGDPPTLLAAVRTSDIAIIRTSYEFDTTLQIFNHCLTGTELDREQGLSLLVGAIDSLRDG